MKKNLLALASLAMAFCASAQVEALWVDPDMCGLTSTKTATDGGTIVAQGDAGTLMLAYADDWGIGGIDANGYNSIRVNGVDCGRVPNGAVGNSNPAGWTIYSAAYAGAVFRFDANKDGYLTIPSKFTTSKNYWVFEGLAGEAEECVAYGFGMQITGRDEVPGGVIAYTIPADEMGYFDTASADFDKYSDGSAIRTPEKVYNQELSMGVNGYGVLMFPVYEGCKYLFGAQGSKMTCPGVVFSEDAPVATIYGEDGEAQELTFSFGSNGGDTTAIESIITDQTVDENAPIYNVMGQRVTKEYKGILIQNGKKFVNF